MASRNPQSITKRNREIAVKERRERKAEKKAERKREAAEGGTTDVATDVELDGEVVDGEIADTDAEPAEPAAEGESL
jgi:hypothetical protein